MKISIFRRVKNGIYYFRKKFGIWIPTLFIGFFILLVRILVNIFMILDYVFFPSLIYKKLKTLLLLLVILGPVLPFYTDF